MGGILSLPSLWWRNRSVVNSSHESPSFSTPAFSAVVQDGCFSSMEQSKILSYGFKEHFESEHMYTPQQAPLNEDTSSLKFAENDRKNVVPFCELCQKMLSSRKSLKRHISTVHLKEKRPQCVCEKCGKFLSSPSSLKRHVSAIHKNVSAKKYSQRPKLSPKCKSQAHSKLSCIICFRKISNAAVYSRHVIQHKKGKRASHSNPSKGC